MIHHLFDLSTGLFTGRAIDANEETRAANCPEGFGWADGVADWQAQRVDLEVLEQLRAAEIALLEALGTDFEQQMATEIDNLRRALLIDYIPPSPGPDYQWSATRKRWVLTAEAVQRQARHAAAVSEIHHLETNVQPRIARELLAARLDGVAPGEDTVMRFRQLEQRIVELRADIAPATNISVGGTETGGRK